MLSSAQRRGAETEGASLAVELRRRGLDCTAVAVRAAAGGGASLDVETVGRGHQDWWRSLVALRRLCSRADLVVAYGSITLPACSIAMTGLRSTLVYRNIGEPQAWVRGTLHRWRTRLLYRRVDHVAALFPAAAETITKLFGVPVDAVTTIPNARNSAMIEPASDVEREAARRRLGLDVSADIVVQIGALAQEKRVDTGIRVTKLLGDAQLLVVGDGPLGDELRQQAIDAMFEVRFLGALDDVSDVLHAADVLLLTSTTEGMPGVVIEAGLAGLPAVAADVGGTGEVVASPGWLYPLGSTDEEIAAKVRAVLEQRVACGTEAASHVRERFTWDQVGTGWVELIRRLAPTFDPVQGAGNDPTVSVVLPVFNGAAGIQAAIASVLQQDHQDFELIVVDDGSTDATPELLAEHRDDARVRVIRNRRNLGLVASLNRGVAASRGALIARLDHDDLCRTSRLGRQVEVFRSHPGTVLCGTAFDRVDDTGAFVRRSTPAQSHAALAVKLFASNNLCHSSVMFRRSTFVDAGGYDESWFPIEDYELWTRLMQRGQYRGLASVEVSYAESPAGISQRLSQTQRELRTALVARMSDAAGFDFVGQRPNGHVGDIDRVRQIGRLRNATVTSLRRRRISVRGASLEARRMTLVSLAHRPRPIRHLLAGTFAPRTALVGLLEQVGAARRGPAGGGEAP